MQTQQKRQRARGSSLTSTVAMAPLLAAPRINVGYLLDISLMFCVPQEELVDYFPRTSVLY